MQPSVFSIEQQATCSKKLSPAGLRNVCVHVQLDNPVLSLMSHQCTQFGSAFSKLEYINTSADRVLLLLQGMEWGWDYSGQTLFF